MPHMTDRSKKPMSNRVKQNPGIQPIFLVFNLLDTQGVVVFNYIAPTVVSAVGIVLNVIELIYFCGKRIRAFDTLIISLAFGDLFICTSTLVCLILVYYLLLNQGRLFFSISCGAIMLTHACALANTWIITVNRIEAIIFPLKSRILVTKSRNVKIIVVSWICCIFLIFGYIILQYHNSTNFIFL